MSFDADVNAWVSQATENFRQREITSAEQLFERALRYVPCHEDALLGWGLLYAATGRGPLALQKIKKTQEENPDEPGPYRAIGTLLRLGGKYLIAETYFQQLLPSASVLAKPFIHLNLAEIYACQDKHAELTEQLKHLVESPSVEPILQALLYFEIGQFTELQRLADFSSDSAIEQTMLGMAAELRGDMAAAGQHYFAVSELEEPTWIALNGLATMWLNAGEAFHCRNYLNDAEKLAPEAPELLFTRACYHKIQGDKDLSNSLLEQIISTPSAFGRIKRLSQQMLRTR